MRRPALVFAVLVLALVGLSWLGRRRLESALESAKLPGGESRLVQVPKGVDVPALMDLLEDEGLIDGGYVLDFYARYLADAGALVPGEYRLGPGLSPVQLMERVERGRVYEHTVTLPPGATVEEVADILARAGIAERAAFLRAARDPSLARRLGIDGPGIEGFVFPDVWAFPRGLEPEVLAGRLVRRFFEEAPNLDRAAVRLGLTPYQLVILASLVEAGPIPPDERRLYAALLLERLQKGFALESTAADEYGRTRPDAPADPRKDPWNTTERPGLPKTPIGSPSLATLRATADPADTEPVYMVRVGSGRHVFCPDTRCYLRALEEHAPGRRPVFPKRFGFGAARDP